MGQCSSTGDDRTNALMVQRPAKFNTRSVGQKQIAGLMGLTRQATSRHETGFRGINFQLDQFGLPLVQRLDGQIVPGRAVG